MEIKTSVVAILNDKGKIIGTGFVAGENLILTCAHVVEEATAGLNERITICFSDNSKVEAIIDQSSFSPSYEKDVALLCVDSVPQNITPLPLGNAAGSPGHDFYAYGYAIVTDVQGIGARGQIVDIVDNGCLVQLTSQEPDHGMSGSPVLDEQRRVVIGMVTKGKGLLENQNLRNAQTTFATSVEVIRDVCPEFRLTEICPYRSLDVFNEEDAPFFFGREKVVQKLLDSLKREPRFLAVLGPSGSGKSSVVRAGLIPALRQGKVPGSQKWDIVTIRPANDPFEQLTSAGFINPKAGLECSVRTWLVDRPDKTRLMLFIDQFEEVLVSTPKDIRQKFIAELEQLLDAPLAITVVITLRDDFYSRFLQDVARLTGWFERGLANIPFVLEQGDLQTMISMPASKIGFIFDDGLIDAIIVDSCSADRLDSFVHSTFLPLVEFALTQLWEQRQEGRLTYDSYKRIGRVSGGVTQWATDTYFKLDSIERGIAQTIFISLMSVGNPTINLPDSRRRLLISDLYKKDYEPGKVYGVVQKLLDARLLVTQREGAYENVEIIHDALIREWGQLREWIEESRVFLIWRQKLDETINSWVNSNYDDGALLHGALLLEAKNWLTINNNKLLKKEIDFIQESSNFREREIAKVRSLEEENNEINKMIANTEAVISHISIAATLVHRINNLAGTIPVWVDQIRTYLQSYSPTNEELNAYVEKYLEKICLDTDHLLKEVEQLNSVPKSELVRVDDVLVSLARQAKMFVGENYSKIKIQFEQQDLPLVQAVVSELSSALWSVILNGMDAMTYTGGTLKISTCVYRDNAQKQWLNIQIKDQGEGIGDEIKQKIFQPFLTTKPGHRGYGLWRTRNIIQKFGGEITFDSAKNEGTIFCISLPVHES